MPTYEYECGACGKTHEIFHSMTESARKKCPACGKLKLARQIGGGGGILFRGSGFYETDYRSESYKSGEKKAAESAKPKPDSSSDSSGSDT